MLLTLTNRHMAKVNRTNFVNQRYANLGVVVITFDDNSTETRNITALGTTTFDSGSPRNPTKVNVLGDEYLVSNMPSPVEYPNGWTGHLSQTIVIDPTPEYHHYYDMKMDEQALNYDSTGVA